jgi:hypothetical protein
MSWAQRRREAREEGLRKHAERFEASANFDKAIYVWEKIGDLEEVARVRGLKAGYSAASASAELPPPRTKQVILLSLLTFIFLVIGALLLLANPAPGDECDSFEETHGYSTVECQETEEDFAKGLPYCCCSSILFLIFGGWAATINKENEDAKASLIAEIEGKKHAQERARERSQRRKAMRQEANERERALDYNSAIRIWEELGQIKEAARVRKLKARQRAIKVDQTVVHGDYVDDRDTIVKDSVVSKSSIGAGGDGDDLAAKLQRLAQMHRHGILSDEQFEAAKNKLLN